MADANLRTSVENARASLQEHHKTLVGVVARAYERQYGTLAGSGQLLHLLAHDEFFAWLRPISELIVALDDLLDVAEPIQQADAAAVRAEIEETVDKGPGAFRDRYVTLLQEEPEVALSHGQLRRAIASLPASAREDVAALLHMRHKWAAARRKRRGPGA